MMYLHDFTVLQRSFQVLHFYTNDFLRYIILTVADAARIKTSAKPPGSIDIAYSLKERCS